MQYYLEKNGIKNSVLYIFFINDWKFGYANKPKNMVGYSIKNKTLWGLKHLFKKS